MLLSTCRRATQTVHQPNRYSNSHAHPPVNSPPQRWALDRDTVFMGFFSVHFSMVVAYDMCRDVVGRYSTHSLTHSLTHETVYEFVRKFVSEFTIIIIIIHVYFRP